LTFCHTLPIQMRASFFYHQITSIINVDVIQAVVPLWQSQETFCDGQTDRRRHQLKPPPTRRVSGYCTSQDSPWYPGGHWQCSTSKALDWPVSLSTAMSKLTSLRLHHITNQAALIELFIEDSNVNPLTPTVAIWVQLVNILCQTGLSRHLYFWHPDTLTLRAERQRVPTGDAWAVPKRQKLQMTA